ncbi:aminotransferase class V-fold PLP-dependent enzyme [Sphingomonas naphthae]|uniref:Cysteine desulfurase n=1 Tax=Sphingomonas naphthae TaxID=1813468 RepID=A0ABY7TQG1_9SPHN|nr:aminotransferase class V-fold PLP-dependent enzyme [Sphingomonas naphthae]WCT74921.1 aminotransferase class V-fold PLP-dependent enzyme [Sphingomonas naphthae]
MNRLYLDHAATTPVLPEARAGMAEALARWANPSSPHAEGRAARAVLEAVRGRIAAALGWTGAVILTSGASEALAIAWGGAKRPGRARSAVEHDAVRRLPGEAVTLPVDRDGGVDGGAIPADSLVAIQHVNNETGVGQPAGEIAAAVRAKGGLWLADCAQSAGKIDLPDADFIAVSAHKLGGPPGIGALLVRDLNQLSATGGQEQGYRGGTENVPAAIGFAAALEAWVRPDPALRTRLDAAIVAEGGEVVAATAERLPEIASYRMPGVPAAAQLIHFDMAGIAVSAGSACSSGSVKPSHVLAAMGWDEAAAREVVRVSFGPETDAAALDRFVGAWRALARRAQAA